MGRWAKAGAARGRAGLRANPFAPRSKARQSYFATCPRDEEGHCEESGRAGAAKRPKKPAARKPAAAKPTGKPADSGKPAAEKPNNSEGAGAAGPHADDPDLNRPSRPENRHEGAAPKALSWRDPPPKRPRGEAFRRPVGDASQTKLGDQAEELARRLGFRNILPPGQRCHRPGEVAEKGSTIDTEYDHSGRAYELKMCQSTATEYRLKAKASEKEAKLRYAELHGLTAYTMVGVRDVDTGEVHFYAAREPGMVGAEVSPEKFDYIGSAKA